MTYSSYSQHERYLRMQEQIMRRQQPKTGRSTALMAGVAVIVLGSIAASAQVSSPFANKKKKQAWETTTAPAAQPQPSWTRPSQASSNPRVAVPPSYQQHAPNLGNPSYGLASKPQSQSGTFTAPSNTPTYAGSTPNHQPQPKALQGHYNPSTSSVPSQGTFSGREGVYQPSYQNTKAPKQSHGSTQSYGTAQNYSGSQNYNAPRTHTGHNSSSQSLRPNPDSEGHYYPGRPKTPPNYGSYQAQNQNTQMWGQASAQQQPSFTNSQRPKASWKEKLGLSNLATTLSGFLKLGAAATDADTQRDDGWREDFIADGMIRGEVSAITQGGLEYGIGAEVRGQYDQYRRGFGGRIGDCPANVLGCASQDIAGTPTAIRGHTSQFYTDGLDNTQDGAVALEGAYLFLRSAYGDITVGRDDGAAYLFSLGAPTLVAVNASNTPVDYTGLDSVKTLNDASGFAEKITYVSPRLLGDQIGVGVQFGASYSLDAKACGVDYCVNNEQNIRTGTLAPDLEDVIEFGLSLDRKFDNGLSVEATATYATASEKSSLTAFDDLQSFGAGLELALKGWRLGGSYLQSNNALQDGDYTAYDIGLSWKPNRWGVSLAYGHAKDDNASLTSDQATLGFVYDLSDRFTLGTGVQYVERSVPALNTANGASIIARGKEKAASVFVEGGVKF